MSRITNSELFCALWLMYVVFWQTFVPYISKHGISLAACKHPPFSLKWKMGWHPTSLTGKTLKGGLLETHSFPSQWRGLVGVGEEEQRWHIPKEKGCIKPPPDNIFLWRAHSFEPNLLIYVWFYWQGHQYLWVMSRCSPETESALLCVRCGPDSSGHCDLFRVILWPTGRWQLKNEPLKTLVEGRRRRPSSDANPLAPLAGLLHSLECFCK